MDPVYAAQDKIKKDFGLAKINVVHNENYKRHGLKSYVYLLNRYRIEPTKLGPYRLVDRPKEHGILPEKLKAAIGGTLHTEKVLVKKSAPEDDAPDGEVPAEDQQNDEMYLCEVAIGKPAQKLMLDFDTGSADTWVCSTAQTKGTQKGHNVFDPKASETWKKLKGLAWKIEYGDGSNASGSCGKDVLDIGGLKIKNQCIEIAEKMSAQFAKSTGDGLLGLAWSKINTVTEGDDPEPQSTPVENMIKQEDIPKDAELFTSAFYSSRDKKAKSFYTFGYIDQDLVKSSKQAIHWAEVDKSQGFWMFKSESASLDGEKLDQAGNTAIADTGTTLALMGDETVDALYKKIPGATYDYLNQGYIFPIDTSVDQLPEFKVAVGDKEFVIQKEDLAFAPTDDGKSWYGGVQSRGMQPFDILGDTFLKSCYCIWDVGNTRFGAVPKLEKAQNLEPPATGGGDGDGEKTRVFSTDMLSGGAASTGADPGEL
ncbi:acid protease [Xylariomycetidae sp. FL2044]|nr:acid protease [Xylariomycetidae sp. FL2044]